APPLHTPRRRRPSASSTTTSPRECRGCPCAQPAPAPTTPAPGSPPASTPASCDGCSFGHHPRQPQQLRADLQPALPELAGADLDPTMPFLVEKQLDAHALAREPSATPHRQHRPPRHPLHRLLQPRPLARADEQQVAPTHLVARLQPPLLDAPVLQLPL